MGDERLDSIGLPRRAFLKRAALGAFVAPVVVSFGLDGVAEASTCVPNQTFSNQFLTLTFVIGAYQAGGEITPPGFANSLFAKISTAAAAVEAGDLDGAIGTLRALLHEIEAQSGKHISTDAAAALACQVEGILAELTCSD